MNKSSIILINDPKTKTIFPSRAFVDTNVILDLYLNRKHKNDWISFLGQATKNGTEFIYTLHSLREVRNVLNFQIHDKKAKELQIKGAKPWKTLENSTRHNFSRIVATETAKVNDLLKSAGFKFETVENNSEIFELENLYSTKYDLGPGDAAIAATMDSLKVNSICTDDSGFFKTDNFNVYSPTEKAFKVSKTRNNSFKEFRTIKQ